MGNGDLAQLERGRLCDLLLEVGPDAPTLCEGWTAADLAAHLVIRERKPLAAPGIVAGGKLGEYTELNVFEWPGNASADQHQPMFGRGPVDHLGIEAMDKASFEEIRRRLMACGAADSFVTDFGAAYSVFFVDPDGLECEVLLSLPGKTAADMHPPGTPASEYVTS